MLLSDQLDMNQSKNHRISLLIEMTIETLDKIQLFYDFLTINIISFIELNEKVPEYLYLLPCKL